MKKERGIILSQGKAISVLFSSSNIHEKENYSERVWRGKKRCFVLSNLSAKAERQLLAMETVRNYKKYYKMSAKQSLRTLMWRSLNVEKNENT